ncbi:MAG: Holliday junction DNA helicase RuvB C-terminal domain-containing protein [Patescibacteria group bacterium]
MVAEHALDRLGVDRFGLDPLDRKILEVVAQNRGVPVGVKTISVTVGEDERTIEDVYEPYLIRKGFLVKTPRGRLLGPRAEEIVGPLPKSRMQSLDSTGELDFGNSNGDRLPEGVSEGRKP